MKYRFNDLEREKIVSKAKLCLQTDEGKPGLDYLLKRGLNQSTISDFQLGYIPKTVHHQLSNRIIFPIFDASNNLVAISSRAINKNSILPIYWHESYNKLFYLYGIHLAKKHMRQWNFALIVEGAFDTLSAYNVGIKNCVAIFGTSMSKTQCALLSRYTSRVLLLLDNDENKTGEKGANKIMRNNLFSDDIGIESIDKRISQTALVQKIKEQLFISAKMVRLDHLGDPDSYIRQFGGRKLQKLIESTLRTMYDKETL